jgi:lipid-A-disaccharide synthase
LRVKNDVDGATQAPAGMILNKPWPDRLSILLVAGESSADRYGARLAAKIRGLFPDRNLRFFGTGGDAMKDAGVELLCHLRDLASIGPAEAVQHLAVYYRTFRRLRAACRERRPPVAVLLDFPEFNLRLAKTLKRLGIKVIYYVSPQLWAWRRGRIKAVRRYVDRMLVILPFEEEYYRERGVRVDYVGHPLLEDLCACPDRERFLRGAGLDPAAKTVAILPGSRRREVEYILPVLLEAGLALLKQLPAQFLVSVAPSIEPSQVDRICDGILAGNAYRGRFRTTAAEARSVLACSDFAFVKSGTSTLEAALAGNPFLVTYRISALSWKLGSLLVSAPYKGLVNLIAREEIVPEYLQGNATPEALAREALKCLENPAEAAAARARLAKVRLLLGSRRASEGAAAVVAAYLNRGDANANAG